MAPYVWTGMMPAVSGWCRCRHGNLNSVDTDTTAVVEVPKQLDWCCTRIALAIDVNPDGPCAGMAQSRRYAVHVQCHQMGFKAIRVQIEWRAGWYCTYEGARVAFWVHVFELIATRKCVVSRCGC